MKILHIGSYNSNLGDNLALFKVREYLWQLKPQWISHDFRTAIPAQSKYDAIIIGGGGLIESPHKPKSGYKLPVIKTNKPVYCVGLGYNKFRNHKGFSALGKKNLLDLIKRSKYFSVRNDGSYELLKKDLGIKFDPKIHEIPDPGFSIYECNLVKKELKSGLLGIAYNGSAEVNRSRKLDIKKLRKLRDQFGWSVFPHTPKDYIWDKKLYHVKDIKKFTGDYKLLHDYNKYDYCIAMRGHSQIVAHAKHIPCITFSTQDKVYGFCKKYGFLDYCVDTRESSSPYEELAEKTNRLLTDKDYLSRWYELNGWQSHYFKRQFSSVMKDIYDDLSNLR